MSDKKAKRKQRDWKDWITNLLIRSLIRLALTLPLRVRLAMMGWFVRRIVAPLAGWRNRALENLAHVYPDMPPAEHARIADGAAENAGRTMIENYDVAGLLRRMARITPTGDGLAEVEKAQAEGRPVLFVTGHYGNFEAARATLVARGYRIGGLYRPMSNRYFNEHYAANMHALSDPVFEQGRRGTMGLLKHIKSGGMGVLLFDVYDGSGTLIDFLGQPAPTLTSAADIALRCDALLVPFFGIRRGHGFECVFETPVPKGDPVEMMQEVTRRLEARIAEDPSQWFWLHRRWKPERQRNLAAATIGP